MAVVDPHRAAVRDAVALALAEDLTPLGDLTSALLPEGTTCVADFVPRRDGVLAGTACATEAFAQLDAVVEVSWAAADGDAIAEGAVVGTVSGPMASVLTGERTALNFLCHLSGVATLTATFVGRVELTGAKVLDTRKTTPGLRALEKAAVAAGGGTNHRMGLYDAILIKENHAAIAGGVGEAVRRAREAMPELSVEVECRDLEEVGQGLEAGADRLLLDNMSPVELREAVTVARRSADAPELEASGGIDLVNVREIAETGVDYLSVGALTHSAQALDLSMTMEI